MAELLGEGDATFAPMAATIVGWEKLSGVWNDHMYPVIWVDFPSSMRIAPSHSAAEFSEWEQAECRWCKAWASADETRPEISSLRQQLESLRESLPASLGIVNPYITGDKLETEDIPSNHMAIAKLLDLVRGHSEAESDAGDDAQEESSADMTHDLEKVEGLIGPS